MVQNLKKISTYNFFKSAYLEIILIIYNNRSSLLHSERFGRYILQPSSGVSTPKPSENLELNPLFHPQYQDLNIKQNI